MKNNDKLPPASSSRGDDDDVDEKEPGIEAVDGDGTITRLQPQPNPSKTTAKKTSEGVEESRRARKLRLASPMEPSHFAYDPNTRISRIGRRKLKMKEFNSSGTDPNNSNASGRTSNLAISSHADVERIHESRYEASSDATIYTMTSPHTATFHSRTRNHDDDNDNYSETPVRPNLRQRPPRQSTSASSADGSQISAQLIDEAQELERLRSALEAVLQRQDAIQVVDVETEARLKSARQRRNLCLYTILAAVVLGGVIAAVVVTTSNQTQLTSQPTLSPSMTPTMAPTTRQSAVMDAVISQFGALAEDENSPQYRAIQWLTDKDTTTEFPLVDETSKVVFLERYVAVVFAYTTKYEYWTNNDNWLSPDTSVCDGWDGLTCIDKGRIGAFDLAAHNLDGTIPSEIGYLDNLDFLYLFRNKLRGSIPSEIGKLGNVDFVYLNENQLTGQIPDALSGLLDCDELFLFDNQLTGTIPPSFEGLLDLRHLYMYGNFLSGEIPSSLSRLKRLGRLYLHDNNLQGKIPSQLGDVLSLQRIKLQHNQLTGTVPKELAGILGLSVLKLQGNQLKGSMPEEICDLRSSGPIDNLVILEADCLDPVDALNCTCCTACS